MSRWLGLVCLLTALLPARAFAAIDASQLGARYDAARSNITFKVYSSRATRVEVWIYDAPTGADEKSRLVMTKDAATNVWSANAATASLPFRGTVYYGYRAWGPNWTF